MIVVDINQIETLNGQVSFKKLAPIQIKSGEWVLCDDILTDEKTWGHAFEYLKSCPTKEITEEDILKPEIPK
jgi:hypothetical protein